MKDEFVGDIVSIFKSTFIWCYCLPFTTALQAFEQLNFLLYGMNTELLQPLAISKQRAPEKVMFLQLYTHIYHNLKQNYNIKHVYSAGVS